MEVVLDRLGLKDYPLDKVFNYSLATKINAELSGMLKTLKVSAPKQILLVEELPSASAAA